MIHISPPPPDTLELLYAFTTRCYRASYGILHCVDFTYGNDPYFEYMYVCVHMHTYVIKFREIAVCNPGSSL